MLTERENARSDIMSLSRALKKLQKSSDETISTAPSPPSNVDCDENDLNA